MQLLNEFVYFLIGEHESEKKRSSLPEHDLRRSLASTKGVLYHT